ncbi:site-2 protease family protein [Shimazuella sp. AN120528]|uniref:site-2 protease family protein n=1 Tax=Shimazuella soli TaxID=1892854 RepID=UPI001F113A21|nr:site-2 protease family protein [Shimazuella soli]MCH5584943.1 site-2 protease family protein [Shimazuella soli]
MDLSTFFAYPLADIPYVVVALLLAFTVHELAHAYTAYLFGDPTAKNEGRLTLNPLAHIDPVGTILIFLMGFGWAKPVPVNRFYFKSPRKAGVCVALAGPVSNLLLVFVFMGILKVVLLLGGLESHEAIAEVLFRLIDVVVQLNLVLFLFNLFPFPPLDGYRIIEELVSPSLRLKMQQYEHYGLLIFVILWITPLGEFVLTPVFQLVSPMIYQFFASLLGISFP